MWYEPLHVIFCLDSSESMYGNSWNQVKKGATTLFTRIKNSHKSLNKCRISVIIFHTDANITFSDNILDQELDPDQIFAYTGGGTNFEKAFSKVYDILSEHF